MKLIDLNPSWVGAGGEGVSDAAGNPVPRREKVGVSLNCPCGCEHELFVPFANPEDGLGPIYPGRGWQRTGDTLETLTLVPSIQRELPKRCWHGFITNGEIITC